MPVPKSVVKIKMTKAKDGAEIEYTSNVDACQYYIYELTRAALRDVAKFVKSEFKSKFYQNFQEITGNAGKAVFAKVYAGKSTTAPRVEIGLKNQKVPGFYAFFQEFGTKNGKVPKLGLLQHAVRDNVDKIIEIESKYLSSLENVTGSLNENDFEIEDEE